MDSPINSDEQDIDEINRQLAASAPTDHKYKRKFGIALAGFIVCLIIIIVGATLLILNAAMKKKEDSGSSDSSDTTTPVPPEPELVYEELPNNQVYSNCDCQQNENEINSVFSGNLWNTPPRGTERWKEGFQDMNVLVGYPQLKYNENRDQCVVTVFIKTAIYLNLTYIFNGVEQTSNSKTFYSSFKDILKIQVKAKTGEMLNLEDVDFIWNSQPLKKPRFDTKGQKGAIVEMYGWKDVDIEKECKFLGEQGYMGVKVFPHHEQVMSNTPFREQMNPWYFMYQPVSYSLNGRLGTRDQFRQMIKTCRSHGVRVYADAVINHMTYNGMDLQKHRFNDEADKYLIGDKYSTNNSPFWTPYKTYERNPYTKRGTNALEYPKVPYGPMDFHCQKPITDYTNFESVCFGWLDNLADLKTESEYVRQRISDYLTDLYSIGVTGFRLDAAKHIKPTDIAHILAKFKANIGGTLSEDFFTWLEILSGNEADVLFAEDGEYSYAGGMDQTLHSLGFSDDDILKVKIWWSSYPANYFVDKGTVDPRRKVIQNDDHDTQYADFRGLVESEKGCILTEGCAIDKHRDFEIKLFEAPYDVVNNFQDAPIRMILSSFYTRINGKRLEGLPDGKSDCKICKGSKNDCEKCKDKSLEEYNYIENGKAYSGEGFTRVHRDEKIIAAMQKWVQAKEVWEELPGSQVYDNVDCKNQKETDIDNKFKGNLWNTPPKGSERWREGYQDMSVLVGYVHLEYSQGQQQCIVTVNTKTAVDLDLIYYFNDEPQKENVKVFDAGFNDLLRIKVKALSGETLELEEVDFIWNLEPLRKPRYDTKGKRGAIIEMFGWKDTDIEKECEFIGDQGYMGVKVFPHHEQVVTLTPFKEQMNPWYFMYQPVSYSLNGRMGTRDQFRQMIKTCRSHGVRVYADAVINHMTYNGMDRQNHRFIEEKDKYLKGKVYSSNFSPFWTPYKTYEKNPYTNRGTNCLEYPAVPYGPMDFHCQKAISDYKDFETVTTGWLDTLADLKTESEYVRQRIADYLTDLYSIGVTGFRLDAAKHIKPIDIANILRYFKKNIGGTLPEDFFTWLEILSGNEADVLFAESGEYSYAGGLEEKLRNFGFTDDDILKVKIWWSSYPANYNIDNGTVDPRRKVIQNDDHDTQYADYRGLVESGRGCILTEGCDPDTHRYFEVKLFEDPYDVADNTKDAPIRMILSSFYTKYNGLRLEGLPDGLSDCGICIEDCEKCEEKSFPVFPGYIENGRAYSGSGFTRVHRDETIIAAMKSWLGLEKEEWEELPYPQIYKNLNCKKDEKDISSSYSANLWNTPPRGSKRWREGYQDMNVLVGYAQLKYTQGQQQCTVIVYTKTAVDMELKYVFNDVEQTQSSKTFDTSFKGVLKVVVKATTGETLELEDIDFVWNSEPLKTPKYNTKGQKGAIIEMYGWKDTDIETECQFIGEQGYMGVKVYPHHEQVVSLTPFRDQMNPWYFMQQPVSYSLNGRLGTRDEFRQMIKTCRSHGVRVYADAVINHMTINGMDLQKHRFIAEKDQYLIGEKYSTSGSPFWTPYNTYEKNPFTKRGTNCLEYPRVPYGPMDFHCHKEITDYTDFNQLMYGWVENLADLSTESVFVRRRIADYLTDLYSIGVSGFKIDSARFIKPDDIANILAIFKSNIGGTLPEDFFTWLEVLSVNEADILFADEGEYSYGGGMDKTLRNLGFSDDDILKVKIWWSSYPAYYYVDKGKVDPRRKVIQNDDQKGEYDDYRNVTQSGKGCILTEGCEPEEHRKYEVALFKKPYDVINNYKDAPIRLILSSFYTRNEYTRLEGLPDGLSDCKICVDNCDKCKENTFPEIKYEKDAKAYPGKGFTYVHRDEEIIKAMQTWLEFKDEWGQSDTGVYKNCFCDGEDSKEMPAEYEDRLWNTPPRRSSRWKEGFQDMNTLVGYAKLEYSPGQKICRVTVITNTSKELNLTYIFDGVEQKENWKTYDSSYKNILSVKVQARSGESLVLEDIDFIWNVEPLKKPKYDTKGQMGAIIEMYGWKDNDIATECEFIGQQGYLGVKVYPHHEQVMSYTPFKDQMNPWYFMYQPVSYSLNGRMGTRNDFRRMINTCRSHGVRVYADAVINHMTYNGMDLQNHRFNKTDEYLEGEKYSTYKSPFWTPYQTYETNPYTNRGTNCLEYPAVPYGPMDFHCQKPITDYKDFDNVMYGWLDTLADLKTESEHVRQRIADYLTDLYSIGVTGFRLDAAKHMKPTDIAHILAKFKHNVGETLPEDFFTWLEILSGDEADVLFAEEGENSFAGGMDKTLQELGFTHEDILKVKIWWSSYPKYYTIDNGNVDPKRKVIQNDDHDTQYADYRGLVDSGRGCILADGCEPDKHREFEITLFEEPFDVDDNTKDAPIRMILSSFYLKVGDIKLEGLPDGLSDCSIACKYNCDKCQERSFPKIQYDKNGKAYSGSGYTYVHKDEKIIRAMQDWMDTQTERWQPLPYPKVYNSLKCKKNEKDISTSYAGNLWNTPPRGTSRWEDEYQDMNVLVGYAYLKYTQGQQQCTVIVYTKTAIALDLKYIFDGKEQDDSTRTFDTTFNKVLKIIVKAKTGETLELEDIDFAWNSQPLNQTKYDTKGQKGAIIEMFGWRDTDIEKECPFIGQQGYLGVKVSPHHEQVMSHAPFRGHLNPWHFMYQPVSYSLNGRLGTRDEFRQMIKTCRAHGVRVYADAVINHMTINGFDLQNHRFIDEEDQYLNGTKYSTSGSPFWTPYNTFEKNPFTRRATNCLEYPRVPYGPMDFHCDKPVIDYSDFDNVMYGWYENLADLNTEGVFVRRRIADYLTDLFSIGVTGFKIAHARFMKPADIANILSIFKANIGGRLPEDFIVSIEVLSGNEADIIFAEDGENSYAGGMDKTLKSLGFTDEDILKVKIWWSLYPNDFYADKGRIDPRRKIIQNDDQDTQYNDYRGLTATDKGCILTEGCDKDKHRDFEIALFQAPYGVMNNFIEAPIRMILSSFYTRSEEDFKLEGLPDGLSNCMQVCQENCQACEKNSMPEMTYLPDGEPYSGSGFTYVHRDESIIQAYQSWMERKDVWEELPEGQVHENVECLSNEDKDMRPEFFGNIWNTPPRGSTRWKPGFQDMNVLVGYAQLKYTKGRQQCTVVVIIKQAKDLELTYLFNDEEQSSNIKVFDSNFIGVLKIVVQAKSGERLELEDVDFIWNVEPLSRPKYDTHGQRGAIVEMYGWKDTDIEKECQFIGEQGYLGVKVFPHHEQIMSYTPFREQMNPWYFMYQPVSYSLNGRMGTRDEFRSMINTCRKFGVRVYADAVINHMTYNGMDLQKHRFNDTDKYLEGYIYSTANAPFWTPYKTYEMNPYTRRATNCLEYPKVPYEPKDFHCQKPITDYKDFPGVTTGWLDNLADLDTESEYVRQRIADYLTDLYSIGLSGFRIDAAKHIKPADLANILAKFKGNIGGAFPDDFFTWLEILSGNEADVLFAEDGNYSYAGGMDKILKEQYYFTNDDLLKIKLWWSSYPANYNIDNGKVDPQRKVIQNDDHDTQYADFRGLTESGKGCVLTEGCPPEKHRNFEVKLFEDPYDVADNTKDAPIRMILSSFYTRIGDVRMEGLPDSLSDCRVICKYNCDQCEQHSLPEYPAHIEGNPSYSGEGYTRVHRDPAIIKAMQKWMELKEENWEPLPYPQVYENVYCKSSQTKDMRKEFSGNLWNTPPKESIRWKEGFQDMNVLVGYAQLKYNSDQTLCTVTVFTKTAVSLELRYIFDGDEQESNIKVFETSFKKPLKIIVTSLSGYKLELEEVDFIWNSEPLRPSRYETKGQKGAIVEMFGWKDKDIEKECEFIGLHGYLGVKVFPHHEQVMSYTPFRENMNPWYFMYQPVSYSLNGRMGTRAEFRQMIKTCRKHGVRVYADAVINHMTYNGNDLQNHRFYTEDDEYLIGQKYSTNNSPFWTPYRTYEKNPFTNRGTNCLEYPAVPYGPMDFHCQKLVYDYTDFDNVMYGWLDNLADLNTESEYVRQRIADYLTDLYSIGLSGFRIDAAKHIKPRDFANILAIFKNNIGGKLPEDFITWLQILSGNEADILFAEEGENSFAGGMDKTLKQLGFTDEDLLKVKLWWPSYPANYTIDNGKVDPRRKIIQNDDHDSQYDDFRGLAASERGCILTDDCPPEVHRSFEVKLFESPYDVTNNIEYSPIRMILSSFYIKYNDTKLVGLPDGLSDCHRSCKDNCDKCENNSLPEFPAYIEDGEAYSGQGFTRVHRDEAIIKAMQNWMEKTEEEKWEELSSPQVYDNVVCESEETKDINEKFKENLWNTPPRESIRWQKGFQDMNVLVGYPQLKYNSQLSECTVTVFTKTAKDLELTYIFDGVEQNTNYKLFDATFRGVLKIVVKAKTGEKLELEDVDFIWNSEALATPKFDTKGQKGAIIEMFGWKDNDIAKECEFIGEQGYMGVKVFPHHEQVMSNSPFKDQMNPWYFMYQPVSYSLNSRMGTRDEFRQMIKTCRKHGVRVYADAVINHMTYNGMDLQNHRFSDSEQYLVGKKYSTNNSPFWTPYRTYEKNPFTNRSTNCLEYPAVPYGPMDFHCQKEINNYKKYDVVTSGWLDTLADLNTESDYVRHRIADYLTDLFSIGLSGFRIEAAKHIKPRDIANILAIFKENIGGKLPEDFLTWLEILSGSEADVLFAENGEYSYAGGMDKMLKELGFTEEDLLKVKLWWSSYPLNYTIDNGTVNPKRKVIQNDDHNSQYADSRGLTGSGLGCILTEGCSSLDHTYFESMLFYKPYGVVDNVNDSPIRIILSSFYTRYNGKLLEGLPDGLSDCEKSCKDNCEKCKEFSLPEFTAYVKDGEAYSGKGFTRVHRNETIIEAMQYWMNLKGENWEELPSSQVYDNVACEATEKEMNDKFKENLWNTPPRYTERWQEGFQDMSVLVGYPQLKYNDQRTECTVTVFTKTAKDLELTYVFDGVEQTENSKVFDATFMDVLKIVVKAKTGEMLELEDVDFIWNSEDLAKPKYDTKGQKGAIIEMYGWKDTDIAKECEFIGEQGYMGVKVFPHHEQVMSHTPFRDQMNPWYFMYQPVSYSLNGRLGSRDEFRQMIKTCRKHGVRVYADAVINHMTYNGMDLQKHRFIEEKDQYLIGDKYSTYNSPFWTPYQTYEKNPFTNRGTNCLEYPAVPYGPMDFHCQKEINNYKDFNGVTSGWLDNLADLDTENPYVRHRIADYLTDLFSIGLSGFRLDAAKHIKPTDIANILAIFKENIGGTLPEDFFTWLEILSGDEADVLFADEGEYSYAGGMDKTLKQLGFTDEDLLKVKLWWSSYPVNYNIDNGKVNPKRKVIQNDDHDTQYADFRGLTGSGKGCILTNGCEPKDHKFYEVKLFEAPYDVADNTQDAPIRMILSSFYTIYNGVKMEGLPDGLSDCSRSCKDDCEKCKEHSLAEYPGYVENGPSYSGSGFTRVHRDEDIILAMQYWMEP